METFDRHKVSFVSVTQQFNTATSMGRLDLNVLLSFAQFEREIISERTRDKIAARKKGKWAGGLPILGYDVDAGTKKLVVNDVEAERLRQIFALYLEREALVPVLRELQRRTWNKKSWTTRKGCVRGGAPFTRASLHRLLSNPAYAGFVRHKGQAHAGEYPTIVDGKVFQRTQAVLGRDGSTGGAHVRNASGSILQGPLHRRPCGCAMTPSYTTKKRTKRYRYYVCTRAQSRGWQACSSKSLPAGPVETFAVERIKAVGRDEELRGETLARLRQAAAERLSHVEVAEKELKREAARADAELRKLLKHLQGREADGGALARLTDLQERVRANEERADELRAERQAAESDLIDDATAADALARSEPVWDVLIPGEQARIVALLVERVEYDGAGGKVAITFWPHGIKALADELAGRGGNQ